MTGGSIPCFEFSAEINSAIEAEETADQLALKAKTAFDRIRAETLRLQGQVVAQMRA